MRKTTVLLFIFTAVAFLSIGFQQVSDPEAYSKLYFKKIAAFRSQQLALLAQVEKSDLDNPAHVEQIKTLIGLSRDRMKGIDIWLRYLDPLAYRRINGPLPVEWETEVFEKWEKPYKRIGGGLTLAFLHLAEEHPVKDTLLRMIRSSVIGIDSYSADSTTRPLPKANHFFLSNRLYLLNLAAIYTTGFECPETDRIIPELRMMMAEANAIYQAFNESFPNTPLSDQYLALYNEAVAFTQKQPEDYSKFDHFTFIKNYINPLFSYNQNYIRQYKAFSASFVDYSLNPEATSIFGKDLYFGQDTRGLFRRVKDPKVLAEIDRLGKLLFYDPILSENNSRSCFSCHSSFEYFTDTSSATAFQFNHRDKLERNAPSLINAEFNHLLMVDGKHITMQNQLKDVVANPLEMGTNREEILKKVLSCREYEQGFKALLDYTPTETEITFDHIAAVVTMYYGKFSRAYSPFDEAIDQGKVLPEAAIRGFNLFMSKAQCATCHFVPQFNGVKPPFVGSEFEVLGVPEDKDYQALSDDVGRYAVNPAPEMLHAFRTGSLRNIAYTKPYMHNGVFTTLDEVIDFYNAGGGVGKGLIVENQTLSSDSLNLSEIEKRDLIAFLNALNENIEFELPPAQLPTSRSKNLNVRKVGGEY